MTKLISKEKMSKKARKELAAQRRVTWAFSPTTRRVENKKLYNRNRKSHAGRDDYGMGFRYVPCESLFMRLHSNAAVFFLCLDR